MREFEPDKLEGPEMSEAEVERLLVDAYNVPEIPATLINKIDQAVHEQWGESPRVARREPNWLIGASSRAARSWKTWPVATSLAVVLLLAVLFRNDAHAHTWAAIVEALSKQPIVQLGVAGISESEQSWLSISERRIGQRSEEIERVFDLAQGVVLERGTKDSQARRLKLSEFSAASDRARMALSFLSGSLNVDADVLRLPDLRVRDESWRHVGDAVEVKVLLETDQVADALQLTLMVDPKTNLPRNCLVSNRDGIVRNVDLTYPNTRSNALIAQVFPAGMPIVDVADSDASAKSSAVSASQSATGDPVTLKSDVSAETNKRALSPAGAASLGWSPLVASRLTNDEATIAVNATMERFWREHNVVPVQPASDAEILRRICLDLAGRTPTVAEARAYLNDASPDRYVKLVDRLLSSPDHASHLATVWRTFLLPEGVDLSRFGGIPAFDGWLSSRFRENVPYDRLVRELLLAEGRLSQSGPLLFYSAAKLDADQLAGRTARVFLGMRLDCAQCHDDPFEPWTQQDFWSYAAFFARISRPQAALESVSTVMRVRDVDRGEVMMPDSKSPVAPKFLDGSKVDESPDAAARRQQLAHWLTGAENPYFARAAVNRVWAHLFGRGIVDPVDGFGKRHPPRSPELLDQLAAQFIARDFNLREIFRTIVLTRAYQLSSGSETDESARHDWFAQMNVKMLTAEQVYDCITVASMLVETESNGVSIDRVGNSNRDEFLQQFKTLAGRPTEFQAGIPQALTLMNGTLIRSATELAKSGLLKSLEAPFFSDDQRIEVIYLATLSRQPTAGEWPVLRNYLHERGPETSIKDPLADILWALLNSAEFTMNH